MKNDFANMSIMTAHTQYTKLETAIMLAFATQGASLVKGRDDARPITMTRRKQLASAAEELMRGVDKLLPKLKISSYAASTGHKVGIRIAVSGPKLKQSSFSTSWNHSTKKQSVNAEAVIMHCIVARANDTPLEVIPHPGHDDYRESAWRRIAVQHVYEALCKQYCVSIQTIIDGLKPDPVSLKKATATTEKLKAKSDQVAHKNALQRLTEQFRLHDFTKDEILQIWENMQVERVHNS